MLYPDDFHDNSGAVKLSDEQIDSYVNDCIKYLKKHKREPFKFLSSGDTFVLAYRDGKDIEVYVFKSYEHGGIYKD